MTATERVAAVLGVLVEGEHEESISALASAAGVSPAAASRILAELHAHGFARKTPEGRWAPVPSSCVWR